MCYFRLILKTKLILKSLTVFLLIFFVAYQPAAHCQETNLDPKEWAKKLADPADFKNDAYYSIGILMVKMDSITVFNFLDKLRSESDQKSAYFLARYKCLKAKNLLNFNPPNPGFSSNYKEDIKKEVARLLEEAMYHSYITDDDYLTAFVSYIYGDAMKAFDYTGKAVMYLMYSAELYEKVQLTGQFGNYFALGELLWKIREYEKCIQYTKTAMSVLTPDFAAKKKFEMMCNNTIGLAYHRMGQFDSANYFYQEGLKLASELEDQVSGKVWKGIISGNMAQIDYVNQKYTTALPSFEMDYNTNKEYGYYGDAANSLQWAAKTNLALGNKEIALQQIRESFQLLEKWPTAHNYRQNAYQTAAEIFKSLHNTDSTLYYSGKYNFLHDSLERVIYLSSLDISQLRLRNEKNRYDIQNLERRKNGQIQKRNFIIIGIVLSSAIILLLINRQRQRSKYQRDLEHSEKVRLESEMEAAKMQMSMFTNSIVEKSGMIEKLQSQVKDKEQTHQEQQLIADLANQTILTDDDWTKFKIVFEKIHPGLFNKIITQFDDITQAELRMGALILLHLNTKQMATVLGISPNSVIKTKQRLRQRFGLESAAEIQEFIASL